MLPVTAITIFFRTTSCHFKFCSSPVPHVDEGEGSVQGGHEDVGEGEVEQEVVCHTPHSPMSTHCPEHLGELSYRVFFLTVPPKQYQNENGYASYFFHFSTVIFHF